MYCCRRIRRQNNLVLQVPVSQSRTLSVLHARLLGFQISLKLPILHIKLLIRIRSHFHNAYRLSSESKMLFYLFEISTSVRWIFWPVSDMLGQTTWPLC